MSIPLSHVNGARFFADMDDTELEVLLDAGEEVSLKSGQALFAENGKVDCVYIIIKGRVEVEIYRSDVRDNWKIGLLQEGDIVGEACLLGRKYRTASITTIGNTQFIRWQGAELSKILGEHPNIGHKFMRNVATELMNRLESVDLSLRNAATRSR